MSDGGEMTGVGAVPEQHVGIEAAEDLLRLDAQAALDQALSALEALGGESEQPIYQRWLSVKGAAQARLGETEDGARLLREVRAWAEAHGEKALLALTHRRLSALFRRVGDPARMLEHAVTAVDLLDDDVAPGVRADHLLGLADALGASGSYSESILRYKEAAELAEVSGDRLVQRAVLNNLAYTQYEAGLAHESVATAERLRAEAERNDEPMLMHIGDTIARAYLTVGRFEEAVEVLEPLCSVEEVGQDCDGLVLGLLTLTEVRRRQGELDRAGVFLEQACELIEKYSLTGRGIEAMHERAELHAARGEFETAYELFREFHRADLEMRAIERDVHARTLNAIFQATEARRSSDHFRELSVRDPLTGLHNRRLLDERLTDLLESVEAEGAELTVGLVDLDHFKRINDTRSHAVGDEVLRRVAGLLQEAAGKVEDGLAVRMGGEEFLILLPNVSRETGIARLENLRSDIESYEWDSVTGGIAVTASIGVAAAPVDETERGALLEHADRNLYRAKGEGRNRVAA